MRHVITLLVVACALTAQEPRKQDKPKLRTGSFKTPALTYAVPASWKPQKSRSTMRLATWRIPGKGDVDVVVYFFGKGGGGGLQANFERWAGQIKSDDKPATRKIVVREGITAHVIDTSGTYVAPVRPGARERNNKPDHRLLGAYVEVQDGPLYVKVVGPAKTVADNEKAIEAFLKSLARPKAR